MSTLPDDAWRDAGLVDPDDTTSLLEEKQAEAAGAEPPDDGAAEEYRPGTGRPDLDGAAAEADVVEQSHVVPGLDEPDDASGDTIEAAGEQADDGG